MADSDDLGDMDAFFARDFWLPHLTEQAIENALCGFRLALVPLCNVAWLGLAVRRALVLPMQDISDGPERTSNAKIKAELQRLSGVASSAWRPLFERSGPVDTTIFKFALSRWNGDGGVATFDGCTIGDPTEMRRYRSAVAEIDWLAGFLRDAANSIPSQRGAWTSAEIKQIRIDRGQVLAPVFERAFGQRVTANGHPSDPRFKAPTAFMDFYQRMVIVAFGEKVTPDISTICQVACKMHRKQPVKFADGLIPGL